jgi:hypothetical protein
VREATKFGFAGLVLIALGRMAATGRLPRNIVAGIRIPSTMRSDEAWRVGHQAAATALTTSGFGPTVAALIVGVRGPGRATQTLLFRIATGWVLGWIGLATVQASRAARATNVD